MTYNEEDKAVYQPDNDLIRRSDVLNAIIKSRENIDWGQSEDGDAFLHYSAALYRSIASTENWPAIKVIRCRDCIQNDINCGNTDDWCLKFGYDVDPYDYCSYGERI